MKQVTQQELDWFVEGEVDREERKELFARLDADADGWKRCALALLEADALRNSLVIVRRSAEVECPAAESILVRKQTRETTERNSFSWLNIAIVASLLGLLFTTGYWLGGEQSVEFAGGSATMTANDLGHPVVRRLVDQDLDVLMAINDSVSRISVNDRQIIAFISVALDKEQLILPVIESKILNKQFAELPPPKLPLDLSRKLEKSGFAVQSHRQFLSVHHKDGSNEVLPMNMLDCRYVGNEVF